jgi:hypothetical protein
MKQVMSGVIIAVIGLWASAAALARENHCNDAMLKGTYGIQMQGTRAVPPAGPDEAVIGVVVRHYDGLGGVTQRDNIKGEITGYTLDRPGVGTYQVNDDCSVDVFFQPAPGILIRERAVLVDNGREVRSITLEPPTTMVTSVQIRM